MIREIAKKMREEKIIHNSSHIEVQEFGCYNLRGSTEHKMEKFFC